MLRFKRILVRCLLAATISIAGLYGLNAAILFLAQPVNVQAGEKEVVATQYGPISIVLLEDLKPGGISHLPSGISGYVNILSPEPTIYIDGDEFKKPPAQTHYLYKHELAHVLQKELVAKRVGGYPSASNPIVSFAYYYTFIKLNADFDAAMPKADEHAIVQSSFAGLELSADCFAQKDGQAEPLAYMGNSRCNAEQRYIALSLLSERWPSPLTEAEKIKANK